MNIKSNEKNESVDCDKKDSDLDRKIIVTSEYLQLSERCDLVISKIKKRKRNKK